MPKKKHPSVTAIILHFQEFNLTKKCVSSVLKSAYPNFDILIVDNGSKNNSFELLKKEFAKSKKIKILRNPKNIFFTGGFNFGARHALGDYIILLSNDIVVQKDWISELMNVCENNAKFLVQPRIMRYYDKDKIDNVGGSYGLLGYGKGINEKNIKFDKKMISGDLDFASATTFMVNRKFFNKLGGFDPWFRSHYEDVDFSLRAKKYGAKCLVAYRSIIFHKGSETYKKHAVFSETLLDVRKNRVRTIIKNFSGIDRFVRISLCLLTFIPLIFQDIFTFDKSRIFLSFKAIYFAFYPGKFVLN